MILMLVWANLFGLAIAVGVIFLFGSDSFLGFFAEREERTFPICEREIFSDLGDNLEWKYTDEPVISYEVVCGYVEGVGFEHGTINYERQTLEDGEVVSTDTVIQGATYTIECTRFIPSPTAGRQDGAIVDNEFFCPMPRQGVSPPRD